MESPRRVPELDLLRAALVVGVLVFHAVHVFDPLHFYVKSDAEWEPLVPVILFCGLWGMPLLFLFAGVSVWHSLGSRTPGVFVRERARRLLVPFVVGTVLLVPPQVHAERAMAGIDGSFADTLATFFAVQPELDFPIPIEGSGAVGEFEPAHLWFLAFLFAFSIVLLPLFARLRGVSLGRWASPRVSLAAGLPIAVLEAALRTEDSGGWNRTVYLVLLVYGFLLAGQPALRAALARVARPAAWAGLAGFVALVAVGLVYEPEELMTGYGAEAVAWRFGKGLVGWLLLLAVVALVGRLRLPAPPQLVRYARDAALPVYVLHQPIVVLLAWWVVGWDVPAAVQLPALIVLAVTATLAAYELLRRAQRNRSSSRARTSATAPGPLSTVT